MRAGRLSSLPLSHDGFRVGAGITVSGFADWIPEKRLRSGRLLSSPWLTMRSAR